MKSGSPERPKDAPPPLRLRVGKPESQGIMGARGICILVSKLAESDISLLPLDRPMRRLPGVADVQTTDDRILIWIRRHHSADDVRRRVYTELNKMRYSVRDVVLQK